MFRLFVAILAYIGYVIISLSNHLFQSVFLTTKKLFAWLVKTYELIVSGIKNIPILKTRQIQHHKKSKKLKKVENVKTAHFGFVKYFVGFMFCFVFMLVPLQVYQWVQQLPSPDLLIKNIPQQPTRFLDKNGKLLYEIYIDSKYEPVKLSQIPETARQATLAVEDADFYKHPGIKISSIVRAAYESTFKHNLQGGSTITQQLVKNTLLTPERTLSRKLKEAVLALVVERRYSKDQILEMYLNNTPYGGSAWGLQSAAKKYYGKNIWDLNDAEITLLAGLPTSPTTLSPLTDLDGAKKRQRYVLDRMVQLNYLSQEKSDEIFAQPVLLAEQKEYIRAPHFVSYVRDQLENQYGRRFVDYGGLTITTTLDLDLQDKVQEIVKNEVAKSAYLKISNGAALVADVQTSEILAYVGSVDYFTNGWGSYDVVNALRQPGSSIKPVTYSLAMTKGFTAASIIKDEQVRFKTAGSPDYVPVNYDGRYHGNVTIRQALANSYNIPAVKVASAVGVENIVALGKDLGLSTWEKDGRYGLSITLGGREVKFIDLLNVYATLARSGVHKNLSAIKTIEDSGGHTIFQNKPDEGTQVISPEVAYVISNILSDNEARRPAFGFKNNLEIPGYTVAVKTGTTDNKRDNWTFGYTPSFVVGVWVGNNDNTPMNPIMASGLSGAAPIWNQITGFLINNTNYYAKDFTMPDGIYKLVDKECGNRSEIFIKGQKNPIHLCLPTRKTS